MTVAGAPAGYFELSAIASAATEIAYFGLLPEFTGRGLGGYLLTVAVERRGRRAERCGCTPTRSIIRRRCRTT